MLIHLVSRLILSVTFEVFLQCCVKLYLGALCVCGGGGSPFFNRENTVNIGV